MVQFSQELFDTILSRIEEGESLVKICKDKKMPNKVNFYRWIDKDIELRNKYARACEARAEKIFEEIIDIADDSSNDTILGKAKDGSEYEMENKEWVNRSKLKVDARKWVLAKMHPKKYGDKIEVDNKITIDKPLIIDWSGNHSTDTQTEGSSSDS
jgi:hypothetical protein